MKVIWEENHAGWLR